MSNYIIKTTLTSNLVKRNFLCYSCLNPCYECWIGSNLFSIATTIYFANLAISPTKDDGTPAPVLFLYYTATYLLVSILALQLIWVPVVDVMSELTYILSKAVLYVNKNMCTRPKDSLVKQIGLFLGTKTATIWSTSLLAMAFLYAVSTDLLKFIGMFFYCMPKRGIFAIVRSKALKCVNALLYLSSRKSIRSQWAPKAKYFSNKINSLKDKQKYYNEQEYI